MKKELFMMSIGLLLLAAFLQPSDAMAAARWDGKTVAESYAGGSGTESDPYQISNCEEFAFFGRNVAEIEDYSKGKHFLLTDNLVFNDSLYERINFRSQLDKPDWPQTIEGYSEWIKAPEELRHTVLNLTPRVGRYDKGNNAPDTIMPFQGTFDGGGHVLVGVFNDLMQTHGAIFLMIDGGTVKNLGIEDSYFVHNSQYGSFAGKCVDGHLINCYIRHSYVESGGSYGGGLVGMMRGSSTVRNCYVEDCVVMGKNGVGGLLGRVGAGQMNACVVENCYANAFLKVKQEEHGALMDGVSDTAVVRNCWYTVKGKASVYMDASQRNGRQENLVEINDEELQGDALVQSLNDNARLIPGACAWVKAESGGPRLDMSRIYIPVSALTKSVSPHCDEEVWYNLQGYPVGKDYKGVVIVRGKKIMVR